jgi:hypothetical protein
MSMNHTNMRITLTTTLAFGLLVNPLPFVLGPGKLAHIQRTDIPQAIRISGSKPQVIHS